MNRPIKFRVWDFTVKRFDPQIYQAGEQFGHPSSSDWIAQQYTGIMDSYGKEICQGDIVINKTSQEEYCSPAVIVWGKYEFGGFALAYKNNHLKDYHIPLIHKINGVDLIEEFRLSKMGIYQIVGNVFDTPELIK